MTTVKVRICVVTGENGEWAAYGWKDGPDEDVQGSCIDMVPPVDYAGPMRTSWVVAEVPLPDTEQVEIEGVVET